MRRRALLATDLDRTLLPNGEPPESPGARDLLRAFVEAEALPLAYVTGRRLALVEAAIVEYDVPRPDWVIADVGSSLFEWDGDSWRPSAEWSAWLAEDWPGKEGTDLAPLFEGDDDLHLQEPAAQGPHKLSYFTELEVDSDSLRRRLLARLDAEKLRSQVVYSVDEGAQVGLIDVLPARSSKRGALEFLVQREGFAPDAVLFAGDSGNDLEVLLSPTPAVLVANADSGLRRQAQALAERLGTATAFYLARGGELGMNGNYAAGILEGWLHYHPADRRKLEDLAANLRG